MNRNYHVAGMHEKGFLLLLSKTVIGKLPPFQLVTLELLQYIIVTSALADIIGSIEGI